MKINNNGNHKVRRLVGVSLIVALFISCSYLGIALKKHYWPFPASPQSSNQTTSESPKTKAPDVKVSSDPAIQNKTSNQVPQNTAISATITELRKDSHNIYFAATINDTTSPGVCVLTFTNVNDRPITQQFDSTLKDGKVICGEVTVPVLKFSYLGNWTINLHFYSGNLQTVVNGIINIS